MKLTNLAFVFVLVISWAQSYSLGGKGRGYLDLSRLMPSNLHQQCRGSSTPTAIHLKNAMSNVVVDLAQYREELNPPPPTTGIVAESNAVVDVGDWSVNVVKNLAKIVVDRKSVV